MTNVSNLTLRVEPGGLWKIPSNRSNLDQHSQRSNNSSNIWNLPTNKSKNSKNDKETLKIEKTIKTLKGTSSARLSYSEGSFMDFEESEDNGNPTVSSSDEDGTWVKKIRIKKPSKYKGRTICKYCPCCVKMMNCILNNKCYMFFMTLVTLYALFMDDIRILTCPIEVD